MLQDFTGLIEPGSRDEQLLNQIDFTCLPRHIAIIMDGNGRWANRRFLPRIAGHRAGVEAVRSTVDTCARLGIEALTLYAFSVENWKRPPFEIEALMTFLKEYLRKELENIHRNNIRFQTIGRINELDESVQFELRSAIRKTANNSGMVLNVALNYGGRVELVDAFRKLLEKCEREGCAPESITECDIARQLYTAELPDPDLLIRTSGEMRISNFLLWQIAYAEIYVTNTLWPDFRRPDIFAAITDFQKRERRFGGLIEKGESARRAVVNAS
jgi:undecaprenyl diphosphate synthase